jgi:hypothetical protein
LHRPGLIFATRDVITDRSSSSLLRLDVCCSDHLAPLFGFVDNQLTEVGGRLGERRGSQLGQARLDVGMRKTCIDISVSLSMISVDVFLGTATPFQVLAS